MLNDAIIYKKQDVLPCLSCSTYKVAIQIAGNMVSMHTNHNGPYSLLLVRTSYFISCSIHAQFASVLSIDCRHVIIHDVDHASYI